MNVGNYLLTPDWLISKADARYAPGFFRLQLANKLTLNRKLTSSLVNRNLLWIERQRSGSKTQQTSDITSTVRI